MRMKKKLPWIIAGSVLGGLIALVLCLDGIVSRVAHKQLEKQLSTLDSPYEITFDGVFVRVLAGDADITDIKVKDSTMTITADRVGVRNISWLQLAKNKRVAINRALARGVTLHYTDTASPMVADAYNVCVDVFDLRYDIRDTLFTYNDSVYFVSMDSAFFVSSDNLHRVKATTFRTANAGPIELGPLHYQNNVTKAELIELMKEPVNWIETDVNAVKTSPVHIPTMVTNILDNKGFQLDSVAVDLKRFYLYRNTLYPPQHPYPMPQDVLLAIPMPFEVNHVSTKLDNMEIEVSTAYIHGGHLYLGPVYASIWNISNRKKAAMTCLASGKIGDMGSFNSRFKMVNNAAADFELALAGANLELSHLAPFTLPICAISADCHVDSLVSKSKGNRTETTGEFVMLYNGLHVKVDKNEDIPIRFIINNAGLIESVANTLLPKANPSTPNAAPRRYRTYGIRDEMQPVPLYILWPMIDGIKSTLLPGFSVSKKIKTPKPATNTNAAHK